MVSVGCWFPWKWENTPPIKLSRSRNTHIRSAADLTLGHTLTSAVDSYHFCLLSGDGDTPTFLLPVSESSPSQLSKRSKVTKCTYQNVIRGFHFQLNDWKDPRQNNKRYFTTSGVAIVVDYWFVFITYQMKSDRYDNETQSPHSSHLTHITVLHLLTLNFDPNVFTSIECGAARCSVRAAQPTCKPTERHKRAEPAPVWRRGEQGVSLVSELRCTQGGPLVLTQGPPSEHQNGHFI